MQTTITPAPANYTPPPQTRLHLVAEHLSFVKVNLTASVQVNPRIRAETNIMVEQINDALKLMARDAPADPVPYDPKSVLASIDILSSYLDKMAVAQQKLEAGEVGSTPAENDPEFLRNIINDLTTALKRLSS